MVAPLAERLQQNPSEIKLRTFEHAIGDLKDEGPQIDFVQYARNVDLEMAYLLQTPRPQRELAEIYISEPARQQVTDLTVLTKDLGPHAIKLSLPLATTIRQVDGYPIDAVIGLTIGATHDRLRQHNAQKYERNDDILTAVGDYSTTMEPAKNLLAVYLSQDMLTKGISYALAQLIKHIASPEDNTRKKSKHIDQNPTKYYVEFIRDARQLLLTGNTSFQALLDQTVDPQKTIQLLQKIAELQPTNIKKNVLRGKVKPSKAEKEAKETIEEYNALQWLPETEA